MTDLAIRKPAGLAAMGSAVSSFLYVLVLALAAEGGGMEAPMAAVAERTRVDPANWLLAATGLLMTLAVAGVVARLATADPGGPSLPWLYWGGGLGLIGAAMMAAHGFYDAFATPILQARWDAAQQMPELEPRAHAIAAMSGLANQTDPKGLGSFLFMGFFVLVVARIALAHPDRPLSRPLPELGLTHAVLLVLLFALGMSNLDPVRGLVAGIAMGVTGPIWWFLVGRELLTRE